MLSAWNRERSGLNVVLALAFVALTAGIIVAGFRFRRLQENNLKFDIRNELTAIADLQVRRIVAWRNERAGDASVIAANPALEDLEAGRQDGRLRVWLEGFRRLYGYAEIAVLGPHTETHLTASGSPFPVDAEVTSLVNRAFETRQVAISDLQRRGDGPVYLDLAAPLPRGKECVVLRMPAAKFLYPALRVWPVPFSTAESMIVELRGHQVAYLSELRGKRSAALRLTRALRADLIEAAALRSSGFGDGLDYRGVPVVAAFRSIPGTPWVLVAKTDLREAYAPSRQRMLMAMLVLALLLAGCAALFTMVWNLQQERLRSYRLGVDLERKSLEGRYAHLSRLVNDIVQLVDEDGHIIEVNDRAVEAYGYSEPELLSMSAKDLRDESALPEFPGHWRSLVENESVRYETVHRRKDGSCFPVEISSRTIDEGGRGFRQMVIRDVTDRKRAEEKLRKVTRALRVLSACNQAVVRAPDEETLYREVCGAITAVGGYPMAWIGVPETDPAKTVRAVTAAGPGKEYLEHIRVSWADEPRGRGPAGTCLRTGQIRVCNDAGQDAAFEPWRDQARQYGFKSLIALPLRCEGAIFGALTIYASEADAFHPEERRLLEELAGDISYGVETRRRRLTQQRAEEALLQSEAEFRTLFDNVGDMVLISDLEGRFLEANRVACERTGYAREELVHMALRDLDATKYASYTPQQIAGLMEFGPALLETVIVCRDGSRIPVEINSRKFEYRGGAAILSVLRDITERKRAQQEAAQRTAELERARSEAVSANRAKSQFLAHMSHEIRTPLNGIIGMISLLLDSDLTREQREFGETVGTSARALLALVNDLLDISRIEAGRMDLEPALFDLANCLEATNELMAPQARARGLEYVFDAEIACRMVIGDAGRIRQIVLNLLGNAIKFTETGKVTLHVRGGEPQGGRALYEIAVKDTGCGIAEDDLPLLFRSFTQLDSSLVRKHEGAGLGLAISRQLAELMEGTLTVTSRIGTGSTFLLRLALPTAETGDGSDPAPCPVCTSASSNRTARKVLLVEDNLVNQKVGSRTLEKLGCRADIAGNGREAVEMAVSRAYDLILMDCRMPEMDGYTATREIRKQESAGEHIPIIAMTAHAVIGAREECLNAGMDDYITKPVSMDDLQRVLRRWSG